MAVQTGAMIQDLSKNPAWVFTSAAGTKELVMQQYAWRQLM